MSAVEDAVTEAPAVEAVPKRAMTLGLGTSLAVLLLLLIVPLFVKNFIIFQLTMLLIYALAVLALNILTGGSGQFSLGQSAFYAVGAYTSAILMEHAGMNYALTLPIAGIVCFAFGFLFGQPALRLSGVYLALATFALATAMPQLLKLGFFEHWTGGVQGLVVTKPDAPFGLPMSQDMWLYYFTLAISIGIYVASVNLLRSRSGRAFMAIRDNEIAASAMGVNVSLYKTLAFGVSAGITGVAGGLGAIAVQFVAPDGYTIVLAISLFLGMVVGGVGWLPGSIVGSAFIIFVPNIAESISKGLSGAVFGVLLFVVIFLVPHGARQVVLAIPHLIKHGARLEMTDKARMITSVAALALAVLGLVLPAAIMGYPWHTPLLSLAAVIYATRAALAGNRVVAALASAIVLITPQPVPASLGATVTIALIGIAPLVAIALNMRAHSVKKLALR
jgi:branched-chain amino acid transport system permease protein